MKTPDDQVFMVLGVDREGLGHVAIVVNARGHKRACLEYKRTYSGCSPISWPSLLDLKRSVETMEESVREGKNSLCPVIIVNDAEVSTDASDLMIQCPETVLRVLNRIRTSLAQHELKDPFGNNGAAFECQTFVANSQQWDVDPAENGKFKWRDITVSWYKHLGRGETTMISRPPTSQELALMESECCAAIALSVMEQEAV